MKLAKVNAKGFAHHFLLALIVVGTAIGGTYYLIASKADTLDRRLAIVQNKAIYTINADGSDKKLLLPNVSPDYLAWNKAGTTLVFATDNKFTVTDSVGTKDAGIYTINSDGKGLKAITGYLNTQSVYDWYPTWSPDGTQLLFTRVTYPSSGPVTHSVYKVNADASGMTKLSTEAFATHPRWSPDGTKILYEVKENNNPIFKTMNPDGTGVTTLTGDFGYDANNAEWSFDGKKIYFTDYATADATLGCGVKQYDVASKAVTRLYKRDNSSCGEISPSAKNESLALTISPRVADPNGGSTSDPASSQVYIVTPGTSAAQASAVLVGSKSETVGAKAVAWGGLPTSTTVVPPAPAATESLVLTMTGVGVGPTPTVAYGSTFAPVVTIKNQGNAASKATSFAIVEAPDARNKITVKVPVIAAGQSFTYNLPAYTAAYATTGQSYVRYALEFGPDRLYSTATVNLPVRPPAPAPAPPKLTYSGSCTILDTPSSVKRGQTFKPSVRVTNTGTGTLSISMTAKANPNSGPNTSLGTDVIKLVSRASKEYKLDNYRVSTSKSVKSGVITAQDTSSSVNISCSKSFTVK